MTMQTLQKRIAASESRSEEGFTLIEILVAIALLSLIYVLVATPLLSTHRAVNDYALEEMGQDQGDVMDTAREISDTAFKYVATHSEAGLDATFTKDDLITFSECDRMVILGKTDPTCSSAPYLDEIPESYVWGAGNRFGSLTDMCAVVYDPSAPAGSMNAQYSAASPAGWGRVSKNSSYLSACTFLDANGESVPNYGEVRIDVPYGIGQKQVLSNEY